MAMLGVGATTAGAEYGEVGSPVVETGKINESSQAPHAFGVDPTDNSFYAGDEVRGAEEYRIQKFSSSGTALGEVKFKANENSLLLGSTALEGIAIDPAEKRLYMLVDRKREPEEEGKPVFDPELPAAATLYAFSTEPQAGKLVAATGTKAGGVLAELKPQSETSKVALLDPHGIVVDPTNHDVVIVGQQDESTTKGLENEQLRAAVQRVHSNGSLGARYVDTKNCLDGGEGGEPACEGGRSVGRQPFSPIVSPGGKVFVERRGEIWELPPTTASETRPKRLLPTELKKELGEEQKLFEVPDGEAVAEEAGGTMSFAPEGASGEGKIYLTAEISSTTATTAGVLVLDYAEPGGTAEAKELGWTGGQSESSGAKCILPKLGNEALLVAGAEKEDVFVFDAHEEAGLGGKHPAGVDLFKLGPGGAGCPHASATAPSVKVEEKEISPVPLGKVATLSSEVTDGNAKSVEWKFKDLTTGKEEAPAHEGYQFQTTSLEHKFEEAGEYEITEIVETDDLASPTIEVKQKVKVELEHLAAEFSFPGSITVGKAAKLEAKVNDPHESKPHLKYVWKFGDGTEKSEETTSTEVTVEHAFLTEGAKSVTLKVTDAHGVSGEATHTITVVKEASKEPPKETPKETPKTEEHPSGGVQGSQTSHSAEEEAAAKKKQEEEAAKKKPPTRAQLLAKALKQCKKVKPKSRRAKCLAAAEKKYAPKAKGKKHRKK